MGRLSNSPPPKSARFQDIRWGEACEWPIRATVEISGWRRKGVAVSLEQAPTHHPLHHKAVILRVCDFFDVVKNRGCKQNSYDEKLVINSKKSQTLSASEGPVHVSLWSVAAMPSNNIHLYQIEGTFGEVRRYYRQGMHGSFVGSPSRRQGLRFLRMTACESSN